MSKRVLKFSSTIQRALAEILLQESSDPLLRQVTISRVESTPDLKLVRVYVSSWNISRENILAELEKARNFILQKLSSRIYCRFLPRLEFIYDHGFELENRIQEIAAEESCKKNQAAVIDCGENED